MNILRLTSPPVLPRRKEGTASEAQPATVFLLSLFAAAAALTSADVIDTDGAAADGSDKEEAAERDKGECEGKDEEDDWTTMMRTWNMSIERKTREKKREGKARSKRNKKKKYGR